MTLPKPALRTLIGAPKPPFAAEGTIARNGLGSEEPFTAVFDGAESWVIERPARAEVTFPDRTIIATADGEEVQQGMVHVNGDIKVQLDGVDRPT